MAHSHSHENHHETARGKNTRALAVTLALTSSFTVAEVVGGLLTGSLALLADAGHMLSDNLSLAVALFAAWLAGRPETPERSFGYKRAEILAALANGVTLVAISIWIFVEAISRLREPPDVPGVPDPGYRRARPPGQRGGRGRPLALRRREPERAGRPAGTWLPTPLARSA